MEDLKDMAVLLTGGSRGIGPVVAEALARRGADIAISARSESGLADVATRLGKIGSRIITFPADLREHSQREELVAAVLKRYGKIDILVNNAGIENEGPYTELPWLSIQETIEVNFAAPMALTRLVLPGMLERKTGHIVNLSSIAAKSGVPYDAAYSGAKAGLAEWTRALRLELADSGVRFSTIFPGFVRETGMFARFGITPPRIVGSCTPLQVAEAVMKAIEKGELEIIVNSRHLRYSFLLNELSPRIGDWLMRISGIIEFQRQKAGR